MSNWCENAVVFYLFQVVSLSEASEFVHVTRENCIEYELQLHSSVFAPSCFEIEPRQITRFVTRQITRKLFGDYERAVYIVILGAELAKLVCGVKSPLFESHAKRFFKNE